MITRPTPDYIAEVLRYLQLLIQIVKPTDVVYIAVDGPAPAAKISQQRARRFVAARDAKPGHFDKNQITPGTEFMAALHDALLKGIPQLRSSARIVYSSSFVPGEGEHKILNWMRSNRSEEERGHVLYSADADCIFLGLLTHEPNFSIIREADAAFWKPERPAHEGHAERQKWGGEAFEFCHLSVLRQYWVAEFGFDPAQLERFIDDFAAIAFLLGNDFIPDFPDLEIHEGGMNTIMRAYEKIRVATQTNLIVDGEFDRGFMKAFWEEIVRVLQTDKRAADRLAKKFPQLTRVQFAKQIPLMLRGIIDAFYWTWAYYSTGCPDWGWTYPFKYSPPINLVPLVVEGYTPAFIEGDPAPPVLQLLLIEPPQCANLLPGCVQWLMFPGSPIADLYPREFDIDMNGKSAEWKAVVLIPIVLRSVVEGHYQAVVDGLTDEEAARNRVEKDVELVSGGYRAIDVPRHGQFIPRQAGPGFVDFTGEGVTVAEEQVGVVQFEKDRVSSFPSLLVRAHFRPIYRNLFDAANAVGNRIDTGWPFWRAALLLGACDGKRTVGECPMIDLEDLRDFWLRAYAVDTEVTLALAVRPVVWIDADCTAVDCIGAPEWVPAELCRPLVEEAVEESAADGIPLIGQRVVFERGRRRGVLGEVVGVHGHALTIDVLETREPTFRDETNWVSDNIVVRQLHVPFRVLREIAVSNREGRAERGLCLRTRDGQKVVAGICRKAGEGWEFDRSALPLFRRAHDLSANPELLYEWVQTASPAARLPMVPVHVWHLSATTIEQLERSVAAPVRGERLNGVDPQILNFEGRPKRVRPVSPGARVFTCASGGVPFGMRGTILAVDPTGTVAVLLDELLPIGSRLDGRLATNRGVVLRHADVFAV